MKRILLASVVTAAGALYASAWETPTMGWSSWNAYGHRINEEIIKSQASSMAANGLRDAGYIYGSVKCELNLKRCGFK